MLIEDAQCSVRPRTAPRTTSNTRRQETARRHIRRHIGGRRQSIATTQELVLGMNTGSRHRQAKGDRRGGKSSTVAVLVGTFRLLSARVAVG